MMCELIAEIWPPALVVGLIFAVIWVRTFASLMAMPDEIFPGAYRFLPSHWGSGLATEASVACLDFGVRVLELARIVAYVMPENAASLRVLETSGMKFEAAVDYDGIPALRYVIERA
jgi:GNAT acetyltransferase-like protein